VLDCLLLYIEPILHCCLWYPAATSEQMTTMTSLIGIEDSSFIGSSTAAAAGVGQNFSEVYGFTVGELVDLLAATEAVGND
jgi:hypothetical protein